jgi:hypothetical protein
MGGAALVRICVLGANLGGYDVAVDHVPQQVPDGVTVTMHRFDDQNFPPRTLAMTSRLQCGIPKFFGPELLPGYDVYLWVDASCALTKPDMVSRWLTALGASDLVVFAHPERATIREEYAFIKQRMARPGETYLTSRYAGEFRRSVFAHHARARR